MIDLYPKSISKATGTLQTPQAAATGMYDVVMTSGLQTSDQRLEVFSMMEDAAGDSD